jgi:alkanesulfonate monooxygenase SsuD/methylene tetrahydromethanopterin reductase-like flavin-dependent oxidoreductase (luciferase family)
VKVGLVVPQFGINATKENLTEFNQLAEKEGFESLWVYDRMLYPIDPQPPYPYSGPPAMSEWPEHFKNVLDPLTTLAFIAANTTKVNLGTCIIDMVTIHTVCMMRY